VTNFNEIANKKISLYPKATTSTVVYSSLVILGLDFILTSLMFS